MIAPATVDSRTAARLLGIGFDELGWFFLHREIMPVGDGRPHRWAVAALHDLRHQLTERREAAELRPQALADFARRFAELFPPVHLPPREAA